MPCWAPTLCNKSRQGVKNSMKWSTPRSGAQNCPRALQTTPSAPLRTQLCSVVPAMTVFPYPYQVTFNTVWFRLHQLAGTIMKLNIEICQGSLISRCKADPENRITHEKLLYNLSNNMQNLAWSKLSVQNFCIFVLFKLSTYTKTLQRSNNWKFNKKCKFS